MKIVDFREDFPTQKKNSCVFWSLEKPVEVTILDRQVLGGSVKLSFISFKTPAGRNWSEKKLFLNGPRHRSISRFCKVELVPEVVNSYVYKYD